MAGCKVVCVGGIRARVCPGGDALGSQLGRLSINVVTEADLQMATNCTRRQMRIWTGWIPAASVAEARRVKSKRKRWSVSGGKPAADRD